MSPDHSFFDGRVAYIFPLTFWVDDLSGLDPQTVASLMLRAIQRHNELRLSDSPYYEQPRHRAAVEIYQNWKAYHGLE